jgi:hypothetical protein
MTQADKLKQEGRYMTARNRIQQAQEMLRGLGLNTERVQQLLREAEAAYRYLLDGAMPQAAAGA